MDILPVPGVGIAFFFGEIFLACGCVAGKPDARENRTRFARRKRFPSRFQLKEKCGLKAPKQYRETTAGKSGKAGQTCVSGFDALRRENAEEEKLASEEASWKRLSSGSR